MIHGQKDEVVPVSFSRKVLSTFIGAKKKLVIIKRGDHSLSNPKHLKMHEACVKALKNCEDKLKPGNQILLLQK